MLEILILKFLSVKSPPLPYIYILPVAYVQNIGLFNSKTGKY